MAKPRSKINKSLPRGLRVRDGYYCYRNPLDGREIGLGRERREAMQYAITNNMAAFAVTRKYAGDARLLSAVDIAEVAKGIDAMCGVYFLLSDQKIVYVGQSINVHYRIADHFAKGIIPFDRFHIVPCDSRDVDHLEALYIDALRPKYNTDMRAADALSGALKATTV